MNSCTLFSSEVPRRGFCIVLHEFPEDHLHHPPQRIPVIVLASQFRMQARVHHPGRDLRKTGRSKASLRRVPSQGHAMRHHDGHGDEFRSRFYISVALTIPVLALSSMIQEFLRLGDALRFPGDSWVLWVISTVLYSYGGAPFLRGLIDEVRSKAPGMMTLVGVAISTAYFYSSAVIFGVPGGVLFWELATLIDIMLLGHWLETRSIVGASRAVEELAKLMPAEAHKLTNGGGVVEVPIGELRPMDRVLVKPGEKVPVDGIVVSGESSVNEAMLTGESHPVSKGPGAVTIGGSVNGEGSLTIEIRKIGRDSYLNQVLDLVRQAQESKSRTQDLANRAAFWLTCIALGGGAVTLLFWVLFNNAEFSFALERSVTVMVIACPHALGLAVPLVVAVSTAISAKRGILIRNRVAFEKARNIQAVMFDKTGTLTKGEFGVTDVLTFAAGVSKRELLALAASVEAHSEHPIAKGVVASAEEIPAIRKFRALPGKGATGTVWDREVMVVSPGYLKEKGIVNPDEKLIQELTFQGKTVVYVLNDGRLVGAIGLADVIRPESKEAVQELKARGIQCIMLTGDHQNVARWVANEIGLDESFAEVLPHEKALKVKEVQARGLVVAMIGDGVNDAPALAQADVGVAIGAGADVAVETGDIVLVRSNPNDVVSIVSLATATYKKMIQNLIWATGYNVIALPLAAGVAYSVGVIMSPALGAVLMSASTVIVAINARLLRVDA